MEVLVTVASGGGWHPGDWRTGRQRRPEQQQRIWVAEQGRFGR